MSGSSGASAEIFRFANLRIKGSLRLKSGRQAGQGGEFSGLPAIDRTLMGRISFSNLLSSHWGLSADVVTDLFGRGSGVSASAAIGYRSQLSPMTRWTVSASASWANATHNRSWYGVPSAASTATLPEYVPGSGWSAMAINLGVMTVIRPNWVLFGRANVTRTLGRVTDSPLTNSTLGASLTLGIAYRCCH